MTRFNGMRIALEDELQKIAGELQGAVRSGRRPMHVDTYLEKEVDKPKVSDITKISTGEQAGYQVGRKGIAALTGSGMLAGATGLHYGGRANRDRRLGRQMRLQQQGQ